MRLNLSLYQGTIEIIKYSFYVLILSLILERSRLLFLYFTNNSKIKTKPELYEKLKLQSLKALISRQLHYFFILLMAVFIFVYSKKYDNYYWILPAFMFLSWEVNNQNCLLSEIEIDESSKTDKNETEEDKIKKKYSHPFYEALIGENVTIMILLQYTFMIYNMRVIVNRSKSFAIKFATGYFVLLVAYISLKGRITELLFPLLKKSTQ